MATKPFTHTELSDVRCQHKKPASNCAQFIKKNVLARQPGARICFKCTEAGRRATARKRAARLKKAAEAAGIPVSN